jgi:carboxypeptidase C (cathepsin A)
MVHFREYRAMSTPTPTDNSKSFEKVQSLLKSPDCSSSVTLNGHEYEVRAGYLPIYDGDQNEHAAMFSIAYTKPGADPKTRPLMFSFNGGPGSSSVWLHLGTIGPMRVKLGPDGEMPAPPFELVENPGSWLEHTDLVFIDPIGTGFSRAENETESKKYWSLTGDVESITSFIRLFLTRNKRWVSPIYVVGESYGTTRAAALSAKLLNQGIALNGIVLVSSILNFQTARFHKGNDLPFILFLPSYAATAWYHGKLPHFADLPTLLQEVEEFALNSYATALALGDRLAADDRSNIIERLTRYTGLSSAYIEGSDLRINIHRFCKELLRDQKRTVGRLDSRYKGIEEVSVTELPTHDPSNFSILPAYTAGINTLLTRQLGWATDEPYYVFNPGELWKNWTYGDASNGHPDTSEALRDSMSKNPYMRIFVASGYYDLATPYFATEHTIAHLGLDPSLRQNIQVGYYEAGHMMYVHEKSLEQLNHDVASFINSPLTS